MSVQLIQQYHAQVEKIIRYGGSRNETSVRKPFQDLLEQYARQRNLELIAELEYRPRQGQAVYPDGTLKDALRQDWGYWESKDEADRLDDEIAKKFAKGYPQNNILFEDSQTAVLFQSGVEVARVPFSDAAALDAALTQFVSYESREVREFREAIENFSRDIPELGETLRGLIAAQYEQNAPFQKAAREFLELCQEAINPSMEMADVREMIVQHVLTEDIFVTVFDEPQFHRENVIAHELGQVVGHFYKGQTRRQIDGRIAAYTQAIKARAAQIYNHQEKQKFLKVLYENFYKAYNPKAADRLGIVYTPNEIVRFMIEAADHLCFQHFGRTLGDRGVEILDPATGTGTFITEIIEYLPPQQLAHKYAHELHCNEVAILPYYIANLNIEYTYKQKMGQYAPFENIVFVDTLDNMGFQTQYVRQLGLFGLTDENLERIERQNKREISVIIGNPPYNAWQENYNQQNPNRPYKEVDGRIRQTYGKQGTAQNQIGLYDMYTRFYRWASDRLGTEGIIAFITNNSFIDARVYDGFRKVVAEEFSHIYLIDLGGNVRKNPKLSGTKNNVFGIQAGVTIGFLVRKRPLAAPMPCQIFYARRPEMDEAQDKLRFLATHRFEQIPFQRVKPDLQSNWINLTDNDFDDLLPVAGDGNEVIFSLYSNGLKSQRDEWVYDFSKEVLAERMRFFVEVYEATRQNPTYSGKMQIKWDRELDTYRERDIEKVFDEACIVEAYDRPFVKIWLYFDRHLNGMTYQLPHIFPAKHANQAIWFKVGHGWPFFAVAVNAIPNLLPQSGSQVLPLYRYDTLGNRQDNITDWALAQFQARYPSSIVNRQSSIVNRQSSISKQDIFHYVYAVLHHPAYRQKYELNLKREFPRIPFYDDFWQWAAWGQQLLHLHLNYETSEPAPLTRHEADPAETRKAYKALLRADKANGVIHLDTLTSLSGVPPLAWEYQLGNRSAIEWVLDRYKERAPKDPTIREKFNSYRFRDYKEEVVELVGRVTAVSLATMAIVGEMKGEETGLIT